MEQQKKQKTKKAQISKGRSEAQKFRTIANKKRRELKRLRIQIQRQDPKRVARLEAARQERYLSRKSQRAAERRKIEAAARRISAQLEARSQQIKAEAQAQPEPTQAEKVAESLSND